MEQDTAHYFFETTPAKESENKADGMMNTSSWLKEAIIYRILPDRFASGWRILESSEETQAVPAGTIQGLIDNLDYLLKLGINCIQLNPFINFYEDSQELEKGNDINPQLGKRELFEFFVAMAHNCEIKVILEGFYQHCFESLLTKGNREAYLDLCKYWLLTCKIDGICLNQEELASEGVGEFCLGMKAINEECCIIGYLQEGQTECSSLLDACYQEGQTNTFRSLISPDREPDNIFKEDLSVPLTIGNLNNWNNNRLYEYCEEQLPVYKLALIYMMTGEKIPSLLYGDEIPLGSFGEGITPPPMRWDENEFFFFVKATIFIRKQLKVLRYGAIHMLKLGESDRLFAYQRVGEEDCVTVIMNWQESAQELNFKLENQKILWEYGYQDGTLGGHGFLILKEKRKG